MTAAGVVLASVLSLPEATPLGTDTPEAASGTAAESPNTTSEPGSKHTHADSQATRYAAHDDTST